MCKALFLAILMPSLVQLAAESPTAPALPDPASWMTLGWIVASIFGVVGLANQGLELWRKLFPEQQPPFSETYATKEEVLAMRTEIRAAVQELKDAFDNELERMADEVDDTTTRIEGRFDQWCRDMEREHGDKERELQGWMRDTERHLGLIDGKIDA